LSAGGVETETPVPEEAVELAAEVEALVKAVDELKLDPIVADIAKRHLQILSTMLRHVNVFGLEAALATYFDLVFKLRRADASTSHEEQEAAKPLIEKIDGLQKKLGILDKLWNHSAKWITRARGESRLLKFFTDS
jgi:hypothetical protein